MRISDWSSDVCSSDLLHLCVAGVLLHAVYLGGVYVAMSLGVEAGLSALIVSTQPVLVAALAGVLLGERVAARQWLGLTLAAIGVTLVVWRKLEAGFGTMEGRSEEHTSELQSIMRISYAVF